MPAISTKLTLQSAAQAANVVLADIDLIKGALYGVATADDLDDINANYLSDGQLMFVQDVAKFYSLTITLGNPFEGTEDSYDWSEVTLGASGAITADDTGSFVLTSQTSSFITNDDTSSFTLVSDFNDITSSLSTFVVYSASNATTASYIDPDFISASAAASGFGTGGSDVGGIFTQTGSFYSTTNDLEITGSVTIGDGLLKFKEYDSLPSVEGGTIAYYDGVFWLGQDN